VETVTPKVAWCGPAEAHAMGGKATAAKMTAKQRTDRARKAAKARYAREKQAA
jgi:hypothetical protein